ncbi:MAG TPA: DUF4350 domain-containing protein [Gemmataceae bacterium]|nr:DUF4350 domain-containing protein [Gemmataceae bacterium]
MTRLFAWLLVLLLFGLFGAAVVFVLLVRVEAGKGFPPYSVYSAERDGLIECARLLRKLGWEPVALTRPIEPGRHQGLLILVEPSGTALIPGDEPDLSDTEVRALLNWVERGNTLLLCGRQINGLHRALNVMLTADGSGAAGMPQAVEVSEAGGYTEGIAEMIVEGRDAVRAPGALPLWWVNEQPGAVLLPRGKGRVLVVADPSLLTLRGLSRADNVMFLYNVAALHAHDGRVYFDEYHHGLRGGGGFWGYLRHHGQQWALLPVLLAVLVAVWAAAVRLGPPLTLPSPPSDGGEGRVSLTPPSPPAGGEGGVRGPRLGRADAVDYASAVARIYQRSGARRLLARTLARGFLTALTRHLRLRRTALPAEILAAWRQRHPEASAQRLQGLLRGTLALHKGDVSERQLLAWTQAFDQFQAEVFRVR